MSNCTALKQKGLAIRKRLYNDGTSEFEVIKVTVVFEKPPLSTHNVTTDAFAFVDMEADDEPNGQDH